VADSAKINQLPNDSDNTMNGSHIFKDFDNAIRTLKDEVLLMASLTRQNLQRAMSALLNRDIELARAVIGDDSEVDDLERKVDQTGMDILVRHHPVASDLRLVISSMKMAINLERISDHAVNIAKRAKKICKGPEIEDVALTEPLYILADSLLRDAMTSFTDGNVTLAEGLKMRDKELDRMHKTLIASLSSRLEEANGKSESLLHLIFVIRSLERVGDLSVNIGEDAVYLGDARDIRHGHRNETKEPPATS
jgi:phosphate transport system protein